MQKQVKQSLHALALAAAVSCVQPAFAQGSASAKNNPDDFRVSVAVGVDRSTGTYGGTQKTDITYTPLTLKMENADTVLKLTVPHISITGPSNVIGGTGAAIVTRGNNVTRRSASGIGDIVASAAFNIGRNPAGYGVDLVTKVKFPTADEKQGLGTGERDYFVQLDGYSVVGKATYFGTLGYKKMGDTPTIDFRDTTFGSVGVSLALSKKVQGGLIYDHRQSSVLGVQNQREITAFLSGKLTEDIRLQGYVVSGLTNTSVDNAVGLQVSKALD